MSWEVATSKYGWRRGSIQRKAELLQPWTYAALISFKGTPGQTEWVERFYPFLPLWIHHSIHAKPRLFSFCSPSVSGNSMSMAQSCLNQDSVFNRQPAWGLLMCMAETSSESPERYLILFPLMSQRCHIYIVAWGLSLATLISSSFILHMFYSQYISHLVHTVWYLFSTTDSVWWV